MSDEIPEFGELKPMQMRDIWAREDQNFTPWLKDNISALGDALDLDLHAKETELQVGNFSLDLLAETGDGLKVAIENQFNRTDHSHLGQLLTYAAGCDAAILVWVTEHVREEHKAAVEWLNRKTDTETEFYLVKVEIMKIDESRPAYQFIPVVTPNNWQKQQRQIATALTSEDEMCIKYFDAFAHELEEKGFPYLPRNLHRRTICHRYYDSGVSHDDEGLNHKFYYGHEIDNGEAYIYLHFAYAKVGKSKMLCEKLVSLNSSFKFESADESTDCWYQSIGITGKASFSDSEESLVKTRAWAVENMLKLAEAIPPEMLQEIADAVAEQENKSA